MSESRWTFSVAQTERGWDVGGHDQFGNVLPKTSYPNAYKASARLLQLMEIELPVTPQEYPERINLGDVDGGSGD